MSLNDHSGLPCQLSWWRLTCSLFLPLFVFDRHSVVDSVGGDQDRAVDALLAMSDPDHVPVHHVGVNEPPSVVRHRYLSYSTPFPP